MSPQIVILTDYHSYSRTVAPCATVAKPWIIMPPARWRLRRRGCCCCLHLSWHGQRRCRRRAGERRLIALPSSSRRVRSWSSSQSQVDSPSSSLVPSLVSSCSQLSTSLTASLCSSLAGKWASSLYCFYSISRRSESLKRILSSRKNQRFWLFLFCERSCKTFNVFSFICVKNAF